MIQFFKKLMGKTTDTDEQVDEQNRDIPVDLYATCGIVNGLLYDTSKAKQLRIFFGECSGDSYPMRRALYRTKNNRFFVVTRSNKSITPIDESEAKRILSRSPDEYQEIFGKVDEA